MTDNLHPDDDLASIEAILRQLTDEDTTLDAPPPGLWAGIDAAVNESPSSESSNVVSLDSKRSSRRLLLSAAAAIVAVIGGVVVVSQFVEDNSAVLATAELTYDPETFDSLGADATASVSLVDEDGTLRIKIDEASLPSSVGDATDLEIWLIEPDANGQVADLVSIGLVDPDKPGEYAVPANYNPDDYFVVDISVEPQDGDETHSGRSILRGPLTKT